MNKKAQIQLADLAGFILIFVAIIVFGYIFMNLSPKSKVELMGEEYSNYLVKQELLNYLSYENMADEIVLGVKENDLSSVDKKTRELLDGVYYKLLIYKDGVVLNEINTVPLTERGSGYLDKPVYMSLKKFSDVSVAVEFSLVGFKRYGV